MSSNKIVLTSSDGESLEVEEVVARKLQIVGQMIENCPDKAITLQNVTGKILALVIEYCKRHVDDDHVAAREEKKNLKDWDEEFMKKLDLDTMLKLIQAASYLSVNGGSLLELTSQSIADFINEKNVEEIRESFGLESGYTAEEEEALRNENAWAFEDPKP
ncbi:hypothetical protein CARUB_v10018613mg [Capsella rubella]|uniref:SKP1-like protein n=1 Tax=Capsella rubella TaxID=81985 RepID=R0HMY7_9BRAS|nr:SKP1-like protein 14 [Capsella rubella]EOA25298.1 hypothetical protein CARUB_v10018613mg [Capsella rubella]